MSADDVVDSAMHAGMKKGKEMKKRRKRDEAEEVVFRENRQGVSWPFEIRGFGRLGQHPCRATPLDPILYLP
jgi:hypothetical protein